MLSFKPQRLMCVKPKHIMIRFIKPIGLHDCERSLDVHAIKPLASLRVVEHVDIA